MTFAHNQRAKARSEAYEQRAGDRSSAVSNDPIRAAVEFLRAL
ncbi:MAG: hypothetical protein ACQER1_11670 [Armatimonadota bacterium]